MLSKSIGNKFLPVCTALERSVFALVCIWPLVNMLDLYLLPGIFHW